MQATAALKMSYMVRFRSLHQRTETGETCLLCVSAKFCKVRSCSVMLWASGAFLKLSTIFLPNLCASAQCAHFALRTVHAVNGDRTAAELAAKLLPESTPASTSNEPQPQTPSLTPSGEALYPLPPGSTFASMSEAGAGGGAALADTGPISPFEHVMLDTALQVGTCLPAHSRSAVCLMPEHAA